MARSLQTIEKILDTIYYVKRDYSCGFFSMGKIMLGKKIKLELISPPLEASPGAQTKLKQALEQEYNVIKFGKSSRVKVPVVLIGARVKVMEVENGSK